MAIMTEHEISERQKTLTEMAARRARQRRATTYTAAAICTALFLAVTPQPGLVALCYLGCFFALFFTGFSWLLTHERGNELAVSAMLLTLQFIVGLAMSEPAGNPFCPGGATFLMPAELLFTLVCVAMSFDGREERALAELKRLEPLAGKPWLCSELLKACEEQPACDASRLEIVRTGRGLTVGEALDLVNESRRLAAAGAEQERARMEQVACARLRANEPVAG